MWHVLVQRESTLLPECPTVMKGITERRRPMLATQTPAEMLTNSFKKQGSAVTCSAGASLSPLQGAEGFASSPSLAEHFLLVRVPRCLKPNDIAAQESSACAIKFKSFNPCLRPQEAHEKTWECPCPWAANA